MEISGFQIIMINGRIIEFAADEVQDYGDGFLRFLCEGEVIGEFKKDNIAGYIAVGEFEDD